MSLSLLLGLLVLPAGDARAASLTNPPERVYFYAQDDVAQPFSGNDPFTFASRTIAVAVTVDGCDTDSTGISGCAKVKLDLTTADAGTLAVPAGAKQGNTLFSTDGAIIEQSTNNNGTGTLIVLYGNQAQLNSTLSKLTFTRTDGYRNDDSTAANLEVTIADGGESDEPVHTVEIRVDPLNQWPKLTIPSDSPITVDAGGTVSRPETLGDPAEFSVDDDDIRDDQRMLLVMWATCGAFSLGGNLPYTDELSQLLTDEGFSPQVVDALIDALPDEVEQMSFANSDPLSPNSVLAAVGTKAEVNYALSQVTFYAPGMTADCDLWTAVSDLGRDGLPANYTAGIEFPAPGVDAKKVTFEVLGDPEVSIPDTASVNEGDSLNLPVTVSSADHDGFTLDVLAMDDSAKASDLDYQASTTQVTVGAGETTASIPLSALSDQVEDDGETFFVSISLANPPEDVVLSEGNTVATVTIHDTTPPAGGDVMVSLPATESLDENSTKDLVVSLSSATHPAFQLSVSTWGGTAPESEYAKPPATVDVAENAASAVIPLEALADNDEDDETFMVTIALVGSPQGVVLGNDTTEVTINDTTPPSGGEDVTVSVPELAWVDEGTTLPLELFISSGSHAGFTVNVGTANNNAGPGDYTTVGSVVVDPGATSASIPIQASPDSEDESDESFTLFIALEGSPEGVVVGNNTTVVTIKDTTPPPAGQVTVSVPTTESVAEGAVKDLVVTISSAPHPAFTLNVFPFDGTAVANSDYTPPPATLEVPADALSVPFPVSALTDNDGSEGDETYWLTFQLASGSPEGIALANNQTVVTITNVAPQNNPGNPGDPGASGDPTTPSDPAGEGDGGDTGVAEEPADEDITERVEDPDNASGIATAIAVSQYGFPNGANTVLLGRADLYADNLTGGPLAARERAPLLYTHSDHLTPSVAAEINRLGARRVLILGGTAAISQDVEDALRADGYQVVRFAGANRFETAALIARELGSATSTAYVVQGASLDPSRGWPDQLTTAPLAGYTGDPILLVEHDRLPMETIDALEDVGVARAVIVGGTAAISDDVEDEVAGYVNTTRRSSGLTRYETSFVLYQAQVAAGMSRETVTLASGRDWREALTAGPVSAINGTTFAIIDGADGSDTLDQILADAADHVSKVVLIGGTSSINQATDQHINDTLRP